MNKQRISSHEIEDRAKDKVRTLINQGGMLCLEILREEIME